jgi:hypothetical protein
MKYALVTMKTGFKTLYLLSLRRIDPTFLPTCNIRDPLILFGRRPLFSQRSSIPGLDE